MNFLSWPEDTGVTGSFLYTLALGIPAYIHTHKKINRHHAAQMDTLRQVGQTGQPVQITQNIGPEFSPQTLDTDAARE